MTPLSIPIRQGSNPGTGTDEALPNIALLLDRAATDFGAHVYFLRMLSARARQPTKSAAGAHDSSKAC